MRDDADDDLCVRGLGVRYGLGDWVLRDLDLTLGFGRVVAVLGPNGSGKSTLLRVLAGVRRASAGSITGMPGAVAFVPERLEPPPLSMAAWLAHMARVRGSDGGVNVLLDALAVTAPRRAPLATLSKGTWRKVLVAEALAAPTPMVVLDEPWADLDLDAAAVLTAAVRDRARAGALVVVADHTGEARTVADVLLSPSGHAPDGAVEVRFRGDPARAAALEAAATALGFRRVGG